MPAEGEGEDGAQGSHAQSVYSALILLANLTDTVKSVATLIAKPRQTLQEVVSTCTNKIMVPVLMHSASLEKRVSKMYFPIIFVKDSASFVNDFFIQKVCSLRIP